MQLPAELQSISDKIRLAEEEEKKKRELEKATQRELISKANESVSTGVDASSLPQDKLQLFQKLIEENLLRREAALKFFEEQMKRDPNVEARRLKQADREGRNPVANFFRNLDYALGDGAGRDKAIAQKQISDARTSYDSLAKDQGLEINRAIGDQNKLFTALKGIEQRGNAAALGAQGRMMQNDTAAALGGQRNTIAAGRADSQNALDAEKARLLQQQVETAKLRNQYFTPMGVGQDAAFAALIERMRKTDPKGAAELEAKGRENAMVRSAIGGMFKPQGGTSTTTRPSVHWTKDANGNDVPVQGPSITSVTTRGGGGMGVDPAKFLQGLLEKGQTGRESTSPLETLRKAAQETSQNRTTRPQSIVKDALTNTQDANANVMRATAALNPKVSEEDRKDILRGKRYKIDWNPRAPKGIEGTFGGQESKKANDLSSKVRTDLNTAMSFMLEAGADGTMDKVMGVDPITGKNMGATVHNSLAVNLPRNIKGFFLGDSYDPDYEMRRMFPGMGQDEQSQKFRTQFQILMKGLGFDIQKDATGLQALGQEMENIKTFLPKSTDHPTVALATILMMGIKKNVEGHLLRLGYTPADAESVMKDAGDYIGPRVALLAERMQEAKSAYANKKISTRSELARMFKFSDLDTDDVIGSALERKGVNFDALPIKIRRLGDIKPDKAEQNADKLPPLEGGYNPQESLLETLRKKREMEKQGKKWVIEPPKF